MKLTKIGVGTALLTASLLLAPIGAPALAQQSDPGWDVDLALYGMGAGLKGEAGIGPVTGEVDVSFSDLLDDLEVGLFGAMQARKGRLAVLTDLIFGGIGATEESQNGNVKVDVDVDVLIVEGDLGYAVSDRVTLFGGARLVDLDLGVDTRVGPLERSRDGGESWVDPVVGARVAVPRAEKWAMTLRGDVGGFGVGSDFSWNAVATVAYLLSERTRFGFGYRVLDIDYDNGSGADRFLYDVQMSGPLAGVVLSF